MGLASAGVFGLATVAGLANHAAGGAYVALVPEGIVRRSGILWSFLPWDAVDAVGVVEMVETTMVGVRATDPAAVEISPLGRFFFLTARNPSGVGLVYTSLAAPPEALRDAIDHYIDQLEERARIGTEAGR